MTIKKLVGEKAKELIEDQIHQHSLGILTTLSVYDAKSSVSACIEVLRSIEELINLPRFALDDDNAIRQLVNIQLDCPLDYQLTKLKIILDNQFELGVSERLIKTLLCLSAIGSAFRVHGLESGEQLRTVAGAIEYFQSRRRHIVGLLYLMPTACVGKTAIATLDALNIFLPIIEHSCITITGLYQKLILIKIYDDYELTLNSTSFHGNYSYDVLDA